MRISDLYFLSLDKYFCHCDINLNQIKDAKNILQLFEITNNDIDCKLKDFYSVVNYEGWQYQYLLSIIVKSNRFLYSYEQNYYNICICKIKQIGLLYKLFYFNLIDLKDDKFIQYFKEFIPIFLSGEYDQCWAFYNPKLFISYGSLDFMQKYLDYYKKLTNEDVSMFQIKLTEMLKNKIYCCVGKNYFLHPQLPI